MSLSNATTLGWPLQATPSKPLWINSTPPSSPANRSGPTSLLRSFTLTIVFGNLTFSNPITESGAWALIGYNGNSFHVATNNERGQRIDAGLQGPREQAWQRRACGGYATVAERLNFSHRASDALWRASAPVPISLEVSPAR